jgi:hypothetical protein
MFSVMLLGKANVVWLAKRVKELRKKRGFSQEAFADHAGLHRVAVGWIEQGKRVILYVTNTGHANQSQEDKFMNSLLEAAQVVGHESQTAPVAAVQGSLPGCTSASLCRGRGREVRALIFDDRMPGHER